MVLQLDPGVPSGVPGLRTLPLGCVGVTGTTATSAVVAGEGHTSGTSGQP
jgi:hypothetical protein